MTTPAPAADRFAEYRRTRDRNLRDELIVEHIGLARALARRYANRGESVEDLQQVAMVGLLKSVERFEPERRLAFSTFATPTITGEIKRHFRDRAWAIRVPRTLQELGQQVTRVTGELTLTLGRSPRVAEIADALGADVESVLEALEANRSYSTESLDAEPGDGFGFGYDSSLGTLEPGYEAVEHSSLVRDLLGRLPEREQIIVRLRFEEGLTQSQIAQRVGISQMHVSRLLAGALATMRAVADQD
ncbi:MAG: SigB/SigF/SigG family RNA polymerase sigma factor [Acidimicrobiia bacterium]|nr:SigB/SigF/SigG family RNA polymerase sigma factor [Acidimicrobiia bacterium]